MKEKDFQCRAQGCHASEFLHCFSFCKVTPGTWEVKISRLSNNPRGDEQCLNGTVSTCVETNVSQDLSNLPWDMGLSGDTEATRMGAKLSFGALFVYFCVLPWTALKISRLSMNLQSWEEESEIWVSWGWGDWGQTRENKQLICPATPWILTLQGTWAGFVLWPWYIHFCLQKNFGNSITEKLNRFKTKPKWEGSESKGKKMRQCMEGKLVKADKGI